MDENEVRFFTTKYKNLLLVLFMQSNYNIIHMYSVYNCFLDASTGVVQDILRNNSMPYMFGTPKWKDFAVH